MFKCLFCSVKIEKLYGVVAILVFQNTSVML